MTEDQKAYGETSTERPDRAELKAMIDMPLDSSMPVDGQRLEIVRVPGGWIYWGFETMAFVPIPPGLTGMRSNY